MEKIENYLNHKTQITNPLSPDLPGESGRKIPLKNKSQMINHK